jgi:hypothetical protein
MLFAPCTLIAPLISYLTSSIRITQTLFIPPTSAFSYRQPITNSLTDFWWPFSFLFCVTVRATFSTSQRRGSIVSLFYRVRLRFDKFIMRCWKSWPKIGLNLCYSRIQHWSLADFFRMHVPYHDTSSIYMDGSLIITSQVPAWTDQAPGHSLPRLCAIGSSSVINAELAANIAPIPSHAAAARSGVLV